MKKHALAVLGALVLALGPVAVALAHPHPLPPHHHGHAPEIDPGSLGSGLALLVGSGLLFLERFRRRKGTLSSRAE